MERTCVEGRRTVERRAGGKNVGEKTARKTEDGNVRRTKGDRLKAGRKKKESFGSIKRRAEDRQGWRGSAGRQKTDDELMMMTKKS